MTYLLFTVALLLSAVAAWYAVVGLVAIFAAAVMPIVIMGTLLEVAKLTVASWLYRSWREIPRWMKSYFTIALVVLMLLTSMGIFGFLSKAHLDQAIPSGDVISKLALIDEKIKIEKENINASRKELSQLDAQVDQTIARTTEASGAERAIIIRRNQQKDRARILNQIGSAQTKIAKLNEERAPIASEVRKVEAEVGPIKYIAALIYGDNLEADLLERAVRWVIIMIVFVFDPLAVLLLVAANWQLRKESEQLEPVKENVKHIIVKDNVSLKESVSSGKADGVNYKQTFKEAEETEIPKIQVDEPTKDWEPELYQRVKRIEYDSAGRRITPQLPEEMSPKTKTQSFLDKVKNVFAPIGDSMLGVKTIEKEIEDLQNKNKK